MYISDMDADGYDDIVFGVYKKAPHHKIYAKRIFIYGFDAKLYPKYRCSRLILPLVDFYVKGNEIIALVKGDDFEIHKYELGDFKLILKNRRKLNYDSARISEGKVYVTEFGEERILEDI